MNGYYLLMIYLDMKYKIIRELDDNKYIILTPSFKEGVIDKKGNILIPPVYDYITLNLNQYNCINDIYYYPHNINKVIIQINNKYGLYDIKLNKEIIKPIYDNKDDIII